MTSVAALRYAEEHQQGALDRLLEILKIESISADPAFHDACLRSAQWFEGELERLGFRVSLFETPGHPIVLAHRLGPPRSGHVVFYGHYDVQPPDPLELWQTPPFSPEIRENALGRPSVFARGASDDKGQVLTFLEACRAWIEAEGGLPLGVTIVLEGEEEIGSPNLAPFLKAHRDQLGGDVVLVCDTSMFDAQTPAITTRLRGLCHEEVRVRGPSKDLHSGLYGGAAYNPIKILSRMIAELEDEDGRITLPDFYGSVRPVSDRTLESWRGLPFGEDAFLSSIGQSRAPGDQGRSVLEKLWALPTMEVNGIWGGYAGAGTKTVIPSEAGAKFSFRLVDAQDPDVVLSSFRDFVRARIPEGCVVSFSEGLRDGARAVHVPEDHPFLQKACLGLEREWGVKPVLMGSGASIPIVRDFQDILGLESLLIGFALGEDAIHSPNEHYTLESYFRGIRSWILVLEELSR